MQTRSFVSGFLTACVLLAAIACATVRTVYVPDRTPVRLRQDVENVKVWVPDKEGVERESTLTLRNGWYVLSDPAEE
jgi:hypothetical protein